MGLAFRLRRGIAPTTELDGIVADEAIEPAIAREGQMNPLIGIAAGVVPDIIKLIAGDKTGQLADQVGKAVADAVGTTDASQAQTTLAASPTAQATLRQKLAELALEAAKTQNAEADRQRHDTGSNTERARSALQPLATTNTTIARTAPTISYLVIAGFFIFLF